MYYFLELVKLLADHKEKNDYDVLRKKMADLDIDEKELYWYLDLRKFGTAVPQWFWIRFRKIGAICNRYGEYKRCNTLSTNTR